MTHWPTHEQRDSSIHVSFVLVVSSKAAGEVTPGTPKVLPGRVRTKEELNRELAQGNLTQPIDFT